MGIKIEKEQLIKPNIIKGNENFARKCYQDMQNIKNSLKQLQGTLINSEYEVSVSSNNIVYKSSIDNKSDSEPKIYGSGRVLASKPSNSDTLYQDISMWMDEDLSNTLTIDVKYIEEKLKGNDTVNNIVAALRFSYDRLRDEVINVQCYGTRELQELKDEEKTYEEDENNYR